MTTYNHTIVLNGIELNLKEGGQVEVFCDRPSVVQIEDLQQVLRFFLLLHLKMKGHLKLHLIVLNRFTTCPKDQVIHLSLKKPGTFREIFNSFPHLRR